MKNALIFGVTGQDGAYLSDFLVKKGYNVFGTFRRTSHKCFERLEDLNNMENITTVKADVLDFVSIREAIKISQPDEIYNLAAQSFVGASFQQPLLTSDVTALGVVRILETVKDFVPDAKFYQASSSEMFGDYAEMKNEKSPFKPRSPYGYSKVFAHHATINYREAYNMFTCCGILFNHESPLRGLEFVTKKITHTLAQIKFEKAKKIKLGNLDSKRDWGFAKDYVEAMWLMLQQKEPDDYVIATGESHSVREFLQLTSKHLELDNWNDLVELDKSVMRPSDIEELLGDASKAKEKLGWEPKTKFKDLVKIMVDYDIDNLNKSA